ncbi:hypothetical protein TrLO_g10403 [Triparma laevis f. longispina]|uniref:Uncharacterized protein n=1 Tax=Triparma laevis f. longispina TaxID=1714387 RepID=A0A9W7FMN1_9STRA|nr:hypothetical protein TrLO_g10403 [Triparma laevis f. longispina]
MSPVDKQGLKLFLIGVAKKNRIAKKMARYGVGLKIAMTLGLGYMDILTDLFVARSYYEAGKLNTAYATAGFAVMAILIQTLVTFFQYGKMSWRERLGRTLMALFGMAPLMEGASVWVGKEDKDLQLFTGPAMYAFMKAAEIAFESIPESIIQIGGLLQTKRGDILGIQIVGVISSIVAGAFIMTDGNFGFIASKNLSSPGDPYYGWISKSEKGVAKLRQMFGMLLFNACYFAQSVFAMSLFVQAFGSRKPLLITLGVEFFALGLGRVGFDLFFVNCNGGFDRNLFWKSPRAGSSMRGIAGET